MTEEHKVKLLSKLITDSEIQKELRLKKLDVFKESHNNDSTLLRSRIEEGWTVEAVLKSKTKIIKPKPNDVAFEDKVWSLFAQLGFKLMNKDRHLHLPYDKRNEDLTLQIDVLCQGR